MTPTPRDTHPIQQASTIGRILPGAAVAAEEFGDIGNPVSLYDQELVPDGWSLERRAEFAAVRVLARRALARLGEPPGPIPRGERGAPVWPAGVVGSMTHCPGYRVAVAAHTDQVMTLGVDAEPHRPLPPGVLAEISLTPEREQLELLAAQRPDICWDRLLFCAKEALYKAWFPLTRRWLGFDEACVTLDPNGTFLTELLARGPSVGRCRVDRFFGRWLLDRNMLLATTASR
jgi:4'-phosphopantetheinyl transferase EntD